MNEIMKGITCCADCAYYNAKKHKCMRATNEGKPTDHFYADCPLPTVTEAQGWISVKDKPPTIQAGQHGIIVCDAHKNVHLTQGLIHMNIDDGVILYFDDSHSDCYWTIVSGKQPKYNTLIKGNEITHWMFLPEPPKEEKDDDEA